MKNILIIDSGAGAISVTNEIKQLVNANFYIYIENKFAPLGTKNAEMLKRIAYDILSNQIEKYKIDLVVLACNTLTVGAIAYLRENFFLPIVGTEPNVKIIEKPAVVLCTTFTKNNCAILKASKLDTIALPDLATLIDKNLEDLNRLNDYFYSLQDELKKYKAISLGCTHYTYIKPILKNLFPHIKIYENKYGVAKRVKSIICESGDKEESSATYSIFKIILSKPNKKLENNLYKLLDMK